ncbi:hypothetical protein BLL41_15080 [Bacillus sp. FMQ74]|nr:hypothetical protein BLL41_15080 [Bacillus sp. FMQ74]
MAEVLHITAHPYDHIKSFSMAAGKAFIETYKEVNPKDEVVHINLYKEYIPHHVTIHTGNCRICWNSNFSCELFDIYIAGLN